MLRLPKIPTATFFGLTHGKVRGDFWMPSCIQTGGLRGNRLYRAALVSLTACACAYYDFKIDAVFILFAICRFTRAARLRLASEHRPAPFFFIINRISGKGYANGANYRLAVREIFTRRSVRTSAQTRADSTNLEGVLPVRFLSLPGHLPAASAAAAPASKSKVIRVTPAHPHACFGSSSSIFFSYSLRRARRSSIPTRVSVAAI